MRRKETCEMRNNPFSEPQKSNLTFKSAKIRLFPFIEMVKIAIFTRHRRAKNGTNSYLFNGAEIK